MMSHQLVISMKSEQVFGLSVSNLSCLTKEHRRFVVNPKNVSYEHTVHERNAQLLTLSVLVVQLPSLQLPFSPVFRIAIFERRRFA